MLKIRFIFCYYIPYFVLGIMISKFSPKGKPRCKRFDWALTVVRRYRHSVFLIFITFAYLTFRSGFSGISSLFLSVMNLHMREYTRLL